MNYTNQATSSQSNGDVTNIIPTNFINNNLRSGITKFT
jgi:hypothetical protein